MNEGRDDDLQHRQLREQLGAYALGGLPEQARTPVRAHLDGCASCRAELAELATLAEHLTSVDVAALGRPPAAPPPGLGRRIREAVAAERQLVEARADRDVRHRSARAQRRTAALAAAASLVLAVGVGGGVLLGRGDAPAAGTGLAAPGVPVEQIDLLPVGAGAPDVERAGLIAHTWGAEVRFEATGFDDGEVFRAAFRTVDGGLKPAGEFVGTGERPLLCNMQSAVLRDRAVAFEVTDAAGSTVLRSDLAPGS